MRYPNLPSRVCHPYFQPPEAILSQMQLHRPIPVHAISFNCAEQAANEFLCKLAQLTRGRFHFYSDQAMPGPGPEAWEVGGGEGRGRGEGRRGRRRRGGRRANEFLCKLAQLTRGRFHFYSDQAMPGPGPEAWEVGGERERGSGWGEGEGRGGGEEGE